MAEKQEMPKVHRGAYGSLSDDPYGVNTQYLRVGTLTVYFSYCTAIAFQDKDSPLIATRDDWGTKRSLAQIDGIDKGTYLNRSNFDIELKAKVAEYGLVITTVKLKDLRQRRKEGA